MPSNHRPPPQGDGNCEYKTFQRCINHEIHMHEISVFMNFTTLWSLVSYITRGRQHHLYLEVSFTRHPTFWELETGISGLKNCKNYSFLIPDHSLVFCYSCSSWLRLKLDNKFKSKMKTTKLIEDNRKNDEGMFNTVCYWGIRTLEIIIHHHTPKRITKFQNT